MLLLCALLAALPAVADAESCPNAAFRSGPSANLPDCRAYEQVTPFEPVAGGEEVPAIGVGQDGTPTVTLKSFATFAGIENNNGVEAAFYSVHREPTGWKTFPVVLPATQYQEGQPIGFTSPVLGDASLDGSTFPWFARANSWPENRIDLVSRTTAGTTADIGPVTPPETPFNSRVDTGVVDLGMELRGASSDTSHLVFSLESTVEAQEGYRYWPFDSTVPRHRSLYEYVGTDNTAPMLVGVDDAGGLISTCGTNLGSSAETELTTEYHNAISSEGGTVYFTAFPPEAGVACTGPPVYELFARIDNGLPDAHTVAISEPSATDCPACDTAEGILQPAAFQGASEDGSKVFFTTTQPLLGADSSSNLYEYDFDPPAGQPKVLRVSGGDATVSDPVADVEGVVRTAEDGSHVYFVAEGVLTRTPNARGQMAQAGANNLYVFERDAQDPAGRTQFIASLPASDSGLWGVDAERPADVTPDGRFLVFVSHGDLTPDDTSSQGQVFEYDAQTGTLIRVSIGENGYNDNGNGEALEEVSIVSPYSYRFTSEPEGYWTRLTVSADGAYVFFSSSLGLTPQAINNQIQRNVLFSGTKPVTNIYEYHDGTVSLISDPQGQGGFTQLLGTNASGTDVLMISADRLVAQDAIAKYNVFDARIDGGFPGGATPIPCSEDECQGSLSAAPVLLSPGSEFQAGGGNLSSSKQAAIKPKAKKAKVRKAKAKKRRKPRAKQGTRAVRGHRKGGRS